LKVLKSIEGSEVKDKWEKEVGKLYRLRHPNVIAIYDRFQHNGEYIIVYERAEFDLAKYVLEVKSFSPTDVKELARQMLFTIHFMHNQGKVLHRDITIYNVLVCGQPGFPIFKLADFGISIDLTQSLHVSALVHREFRTPEIVSGEQPTPQSDLYHLGLVLLFCLYGKFPWKKEEGMSKEFVSEGKPREFAERLNSPMGSFVAKLLRRRLEHRFKSALEAWDELKKLPL
jgi:serine/threonine protein kinase